MNDEINNEESRLIKMSINPKNATLWVSGWTIKVGSSNPSRDCHLFIYL